MTYDTNTYFQVITAEKFISGKYSRALPMAKTDILPKTIDSPIVIDGLRALSVLDDYTQSRGLSLIVGGAAVQTYIPPENRRPTSDIDLSVVRPLNYEEFKHFVRPIYETLRGAGYEVRTKKRDNRFQLMVYDSEKKDSLSIEFSRRNKRKFNRIQQRLERELQHGRRKAIAGASSSYLVAAPEDIAVPKLVRGVGTLERLPELYPELTLIYQSEPNFHGILNHVIGERAVAQKTRNPQHIETARLKADLYDIVTLSAFVGYNTTYLHDAAQEWDKLQTRSSPRDFLVEKLLHFNI